MNVIDRQYILDSDKQVKMNESMKSIIYIIGGCFCLTLVYLFKGESKNITLAILEIIIGFGLGLTALSNISNNVNNKKSEKELYKYTITSFVSVYMLMYFIALNKYVSNNGNVIEAIIVFVIVQIISYLVGYSRKRYLHTDKKNPNRKILLLLNIVVVYFSITTVVSTDAKTTLAYATCICICSLIQSLVAGFAYDMKSLSE